MEVEQESLDLIEPTQGESGMEMSEEMAFEDDKSNTVTEELQSEENIQESLDLIEPSQVTEKSTVDEKSKENSTDKTEPAEEKLFQFPLGTVKRIIKMDPDINMLSKDSIFLISKSIEMFIQSLSIEAYSYTAGAKKKTMSKQDVEKAIDAVDALAFLDGALDD